MKTSPVKIWRNQEYIRELLNARGKIVSFTIVRIPPAGRENQAPYPVVLVQIDTKMVVGQLVDNENKRLRIGQKVVAVLRRVKEPNAEDVIPYGIKFKPL